VPFYSAVALVLFIWTYILICAYGTEQLVYRHLEQRQTTLNTFSEIVYIVFAQTLQKQTLI